jgi:hypothetical protein
MQTQAENLAMSLRNSLHVELMKLPKKIRTTSMRDFYSQYNGDWNALTKGVYGAPSSSSSSTRSAHGATAVAEYGRMARVPCSAAHSHEDTARRRQNHHQNGRRRRD